ncbi:MAG: hypothetical protein PSX36_11885 [bacterium]|nr:hypothetical protein [bacterium]
MNNLEKVIFLHLRQYQYARDESSEILATYGQMTELENQEYNKLNREMHRIWNYINSKPVLNVRPDDGVTTVQLYHEKITPVSEIILRVSNDYGLTLKETITKKYKEAIIAVFGEDYFNANFTGISEIEDED